MLASLSPPFFYLDCLSAASSQLGYDAHPEFTLSTTKEVGGCNCETTSPSLSLQLSPPPPQINDCPETALISTSQQNEVTFCYCSRLDIENIMSLALTHEFGDIELYIIHLGFVLDESTTKMEIQGELICLFACLLVCLFDFHSHIIAISILTHYFYSHNLTIIHKATAHMFELRCQRSFTTISQLSQLRRKARVCIVL